MAKQSGTALHALGATELVAGYRRREFSPVEVARSVLGHVELWEQHLQALFLLRPEQVMEQARASEQRWLRGAPLGLIDGVPLTLKDNIATAGDPMPLGTAATDLAPAPADAPPAARMREHGGVLLAKTTMPDYGMLSSGLSSYHKLARNPWDFSRTPGGSSSGAGAAAAAGYGPLHVGTDIGGSLRLPAGWCGIFTLKPSLGRIPIDPPYTGRAAGPMTRTVADAALFMQVLSGPDERDSMSLPAQDIAWSSFDAGVEKLRGLRIGLLLEAGCGLAVEPEVTAAVQRAAQLFERAGAVVAPIHPFMTQAMLDGMDHFWRMRSHLDMRALRPEAKARVLPYIQQWADSAAGMSGEAVFRASHQFHLTRVATVAACRPLDYVL
jgi:Asp-tRNA(Asn)/Glu-tRNA(Gln) amidotransferase A subunit family amidase